MEGHSIEQSRLRYEGDGMTQEQFEIGTEEM